jgi:hypothetical protein
MVLVGIILFGAMSIVGIRIWIKKKNESKIESFDNASPTIDHNKDF